MLIDSIVLLLMLKVIFVMINYVSLYNIHSLLKNKQIIREPVSITKKYMKTILRTKFCQRNAILSRQSTIHNISYIILTNSLKLAF